MRDLRNGAPQITFKRCELCSFQFCANVINNFDYCINFLVIHQPFFYVLQCRTRLGLEIIRVYFTVYLKDNVSIPGMDNLEPTVWESSDRWEPLEDNINTQTGQLLKNPWGSLCYHRHAFTCKKKRAWQALPPLPLDAPPFDLHDDLGKQLSTYAISSSGLLSVLDDVSANFGNDSANTALSANELWQILGEWAP